MKITSRWAVVSAWALGLVLAFVAMGLGHRQLVKQAELYVHGVGQDLMPALLSGDARKVKRTLKALENNPQVDYAELVGAEGATVVAYARRPGGKFDIPLEQFQLAGEVSDPYQLQIAVPLSFEGVSLATLHMVINLWPIYRQIMVYVGSLLAVLAVIYVWSKKTQLRIRLESGGGFDVHHALQQAMNDADICIVYQPVCRLVDDALWGVCAEVSWHHPSGQTLKVTPNELQEVATQLGLTLPVGEWLMREACRQVGQWQAQLGPLTVLVEVAATQLADPEFSERVLAICRETQCMPQNLLLQLREKTLTGVLHDIQDNLMRLSAARVGVLLCDAGLSADSPHWLEQSWVRWVKLSSGLTARLMMDQDVGRWVRALTQQAQALEKPAWADGIDTASLKQVLLQQGVILGQGSLFGGPVNAAQFEQQLLARSRPPAPWLAKSLPTA